jgi:hypothetical protein
MNVPWLTVRRRPRVAIAATGDELAMPGEPGVPAALPDTSLPIFAPFRRGGLLGFSQARWRKLMTLEPFEQTEQVRTLMSLEGGLPLLVERRLGQGRILLYTGTLDLGWNDFPLKAAYMPWVQRLVSHLGAGTLGGGARLTGHVGEAQAIPLPERAVDVRITGPDGPVPLSVQGGMVTFTPTRIGAYVVEVPGAPPLGWVAVNADPEESDVRPGPSLIETAASVDPERFTRRFALAPWALGLGLSLALLGVGVAAWLGRLRRREDEEVDREAA